jgi:geranylgeranyl pyrophosphate synthase
MTSGQYSEFIDPFPSLEKYWEQAAAKSGAFFALASRSAAQLVIDNIEGLSDFDHFGFHLGLITQIRDDLDDVRPSGEKTTHGQRREISRSLPVIYAFSVLPPQDCERLRANLHNAPTDTGAAGEVIRLLDQSNAALYIVAEMERHRQLALEALHRAAQPSLARQALESYLWKL